MIGRRPFRRARARAELVGRSLLIAVVVLSSLMRSDGALSARAVAACAGTDGASDFRSDDQLVMTYLYYWYEQRDLEHPSLALHPPVGQPFDWRDPAWHRAQLLDMAGVGLDIALAVYWGDGPAWSIEGLDNLVAARDALLASGARPPAIGLFFDFNLYAARLVDEPDLGDLRTDLGFDAFVEQIDRFFDRVPLCHVARIDGRPLVFLWRPDTEDGHRLHFEPGTLDALYDRLEQRLGVRPYIVRERTWDLYARDEGFSLESNGVFTWGAAHRGALFAGRTVAVGPGYDDRLVPDRIGYLRERSDGANYAIDLRTAIVSGVPWLLLETWNEFWEGTAIAETAEHGRAYLDLTRRYVEVFHRLGTEKTRDGWVDLGNDQSSYLILLADAAEERGSKVIVGGWQGARPHVEPSDGAGYFHFAVPSRMREELAGRVTVSVEYFDAGGGEFYLEYDSDDVDAPGDGALKPTESVVVENSGRWRQHVFELDDARFRSRQYDGAGDFRIRDLPGDDGLVHAFGRVVLRIMPGDRPLLTGPATLITVDQTWGEGDLAWEGLDGAAGYIVHVGLAGLEAGSMHGLSQADRSRCTLGVGLTGSILTSAATTQTRCRVRSGQPTIPGLYRWRVQAVDALGAKIGEPSDWAYILAE